MAEPLSSFEWILDSIYVQISSNIIVIWGYWLQNKTESHESGKGTNTFILAKQCCSPNRKLEIRSSDGHWLERREEYILALQTPLPGLSIYLILAGRSWNKIHRVLRKEADAHWVIQPVCQLWGFWWFCVILPTAQTTKLAPCPFMSHSKALFRLELEAAFLLLVSFSLLTSFQNHENCGIWFYFVRVYFNLPLPPSFLLSVSLPPSSFSLSPDLSLSQTKGESLKLLKAIYLFKVCWFKTLISFRRIT